MRRTTPGVEVTLSQACADLTLDPARVVRALEPLVTETRRARLTEVIGRRLGSITVAFDAPYDPHNGAAVARSCEAFGVQELHVVERANTPFAVAASVARGAQKWIDVVRHDDDATFLAWARDEATTLVAADATGELVPEDLERMPRLTLVLGNERDGIRASILDACAARVRVPMRGFAESLNVSVTAAILLQAATRGRRGDLAAESRLRLYARGLYLSVPHAEDVLAAC
jgi:tRNA (guanosine-2'-O-)-methyltransferase